MNQLMIAGLFAALAATQANAQINAGEQQPETSLPFTVTTVALRLRSLRCSLTTFSLVVPDTTAIFLPAKSAKE